MYIVVKSKKRVRIRTRYVEDGLEAHAEVADLERVVLLDALGEHANAFPVIVVKQTIVVCIQRWALHTQTSK